MSYETLTRDGLIYILMLGIARQEGKHDGSRWTADRAYVLQLAREVAEAVDGKPGRMKIPQEVLDRTNGRRVKEPA